MTFIFTKIKNDIFFKSVVLILICSAVSCSNDDDNSESPIDTLTPLAACIDGFADEYPCKDYDLMGFVALESLGDIGEEGNDCWGWTDPETQHEYAIYGTTSGTAFIDITNPTKPIVLGQLPTATINSAWRDIRVYNNHAFIVSEATDHGMQVFDLTKLRSLSNTPQTLTADAQYTEFGSAHNIIINEDSGFAYIVGSRTFSGGPHIVNIQNPTTPLFAAGYPTDGYSHDSQVIIYDGPDSDYQGKEIYFGSHETKIVILDVTDKSNIKHISEIDYPNVGYTHQGWLTEDRTYFILGDETDEFKFGNKTRTLVFDFSDLDHPQLFTEYFGPTNAIDHNGFVLQNTFYLANYTAGMRSIDISNIDSKTMVETGYFDTFPENNNTLFNGAWNVFPYFKSGSIIISDIDRGLFIIRKSN